jgi:branched-chain amino acid transport system substrate-binding protein
MTSKRLIAASAASLVLLGSVLSACGSSKSDASAGAGSGTSSRAGSTAVADTTKSTIVIGNIGAYSGSTFASQYEQTAKGVQAWVNWTNAHGGLNGHPVKLIVKDDQNDPSKSLQFVKQLIEGDHAVAILAPVAQGTDNAWASYAQSKQVPVIGGVSLDATWLTNPYMLSTNDTISGYLTSQIAAAKSIGTKVGEFACAEQAACKTGVSTFQSLAQKVGLQWAGAQLVASSATDYIAPCLAFKQAGADVVVPETSADVITRIAASCSAQGYHPGYVVPTANLDDAAINNPALDGALGVSYTPLWYVDNAVTHDFFTEYKKDYPNDEIGGHSTLGWQAGVVFAAALKNAPDTVTGQSILDGLYAQPANSTYGGWTPPLTYVAGKAAQTQPCMWYTGIKDKKLTAPRGTNFVCSN